MVGSPVSKSLNRRAMLCSMNRWRRQGNVLPKSIRCQPASATANITTSKSISNRIPNNETEIRDQKSEVRGQREELRAFTARVPVDLVRLRRIDPRAGSADDHGQQGRQN